MIPDDQNAIDQNSHFQILGVCWLAYGILRLLAAVWLVSFSNTATVMFGALLARVADPFTMMSNFHLVYTAIIALSVLCGILGLLAGLALLAGHRYGRTVALIAGFLSLSEIPLGITLGIYTLVLLLPLGAKDASPAAHRSGAPELRSHPSAM